MAINSVIILKTTGPSNDIIKLTLQESFVASCVPQTQMVLEPGEGMRFVPTAPERLVQADDLKAFQSPNLKLILAMGAAGKDGVDGAGVGYVSPTPIPIDDGDTYSIPAGKKLDSISIIPATGDRTISVGYSAGEGEVIDMEEIPSDDAASFPVGKYYHNGITLHFTGFTGSVLIYIL